MAGGSHASSGKLIVASALASVGLSAPIDAGGNWSIACAQVDSNGCAYDPFEWCYSPHMLVHEWDHTCAEPWLGCEE